MNKIKKAIRSKIIQSILVCKKFRIEDSIIIFSEARGGSTWLMEILSKIPKVAVNWEPLHVNNGVVPKSLEWGWRPDIDKNTNNKEYYGLIKKILEFSLHSKWSRRSFTQQKFKEIINSKIVLTKFVRANLLMGYITNHFNFKNKPFFLVRHPLDVCISRIKTFEEEKEKTVSTILENNKHANHHDYVKNLKTHLEVEIANWCLNNCIVYKDFDTLKKVTIVFYSDLVLNPEKEVSRVLKTINDLSEKDVSLIVNSVNFRKPSRSDYKKDFINNPINQLEKNINNLNALEKESVQSVFDYFDFKLFNVNSCYPNKGLL